MTLGRCPLSIFCSRGPPPEVANHVPPLEPFFRSKNVVPAQSTAENRFVLPCRLQCSLTRLRVGWQMLKGLPECIAWITRSQETALSFDPTVGLCPGPYSGPRGGQVRMTFFRTQLFDAGRKKSILDLLNSPYGVVDCPFPKGETPRMCLSKLTLKAVHSFLEKQP